jgi:O-antigen/teichoic acid export membrane protein
VSCNAGRVREWFASSVVRAIVNIFLGSVYAHAWPVLAIMLLYPIHQSMGQIRGTMLFASGQTHRYMFVRVATVFVC